MIEKPLKVYIHGSIGRGHIIEQQFKKLGIENPLEYKFNDPWLIYYVNQNNEIAFTEPGSDLYYIITNSSDWTEMKMNPSKITHKFLITVKEGSGSCDGCHIGSKCTHKQKAKCQIASLLTELTEYDELTGKVLEIEEVPN